MKEPEERLYVGITPNGYIFRRKDEILANTKANGIEPIYYAMLPKVGSPDCALEMFNAEHGRLNMASMEMLRKRYHTMQETLVEIGKRVCRHTDDFSILKETPCPAILKWFTIGRLTATTERHSL